MATAAPELVVTTNEPEYEIVEEKPVICDSFWACILNDYLDSEDWLIDDATTFTETTVHTPRADLDELRETITLEEIDELRELSAPKVEEITFKTRKERKKKKKKKRKKERSGGKPDEPSLAGDSVIPVVDSQKPDDLAQDQKGDLQIDNSKALKSREERETLDIIRLDQESGSDQLPYRTPRRVVSPGPEMEINEDLKISRTLDHEISYKDSSHRPTSRSRGRLQNDERNDLHVTLSRSRSRSRGPLPKSRDDETDLQVALSRSHSQPRALLSADSILVQADSMMSDRLRKNNADVIHYAPIMTSPVEDQVPQSHGRPDIEPEDERLSEAISPQQILIPHEVKVAKKPKVTRRPLKDFEDKPKRRIPVDPEEGESVRSQRSQGSQISARTNGTSGSRSRSRGRPRPEDLFNVTDTVVDNASRSGDGTRDHPIEIAKRREGDVTAKASRHRRQEDDPVRNESRHRRHEAGVVRNESRHRRHEVDVARTESRHGRHEPDAARTESRHRYLEVDAVRNDSRHRRHEADAVRNDSRHRRYEDDIERSRHQRREEDFINLSRQRRHDVDAFSNGMDLRRYEVKNDGDRRKSRDVKKSHKERRLEKEKKSRASADEQLRWLLEETKRSNKESTRRRKVDRKEALDRIRAIKARLANVDP